MINKFVFAVLLLSPLLVTVFGVESSVPVAASSSIIRVPDDYQTIQEAVNTANLGDIVLVSAGTYCEHVRVNKTLSLIGDNPETTIIDGNKTGIVLYVTANNVEISGFTLQNGGGWSPHPGCGIFLNCCNSSSIYANTITSNAYGIWLDKSSGNMISNNQILNNGGGHPSLLYGVGIQLAYSNSNVICHNSISNNVCGGVSMSYSYDNIVNQNTFTNHPVGVVSLSSSAGNMVSDNIVTLNGAGIGLSGSTNNTIRRNQIFKNKDGKGIAIGGSRMNIISENNITENEGNGIDMGDISPHNLIVGNTISNNVNGIKIHYSNGSVIHHNNFINNTRNVPEDVYPNVNDWDGGYPSGGNYWSDYNGADFFGGSGQNETGSDGIGDAPHTLDARNEDGFPFMGPISFFDVGAWNGTLCDVRIVSNSTISDFQLDKTRRTISFNVTGVDYTVGFCRVTIPNMVVRDLWQNKYTTLVDGKQPLTIRNWTDGAYTYIYLTYLHSEHEVTIIAEFLAAVILPLFTVTTLCTVILRRKIKP